MQRAEQVLSLAWNHCASPSAIGATVNKQASMLPGSISHSFRQTLGSSQGCSSTHDLDIKPTVHTTSSGWLNAGSTPPFGNTISGECPPFTRVARIWHLNPGRLLVVTLLLIGDWWIYPSFHNKLHGDHWAIFASGGTLKGQDLISWSY